MDKVVCEYCTYVLEENEHYVELEDDTTLCETCFFDMAIKKYSAVEKQA